MSPDLDAAQVAVPTDADPRTGLVSRRTVLLFTGAAAAATALESERLYSAISDAWFAPDIEAVPVAVPPELQDKGLSGKNEHYRPDFSRVVAEGISLYEAMGGRPVYRKPPFYITHWEIVKSVVQHYRETGKIQMSAKDKPYHRLVAFSGADFKQTYRMYDNDPGSGTQRLATERLVGASKDEKANIVAATYSEMFLDAKAAIDAARQGGRVSTSVLFAYFLHRNNGDLVPSLLDTTLFLKMAARTHVPTLANNAARKSKFGRIYSNIYDNAQLLSSMFYDEFANAAPLEELLNVVGRESDLNNTKPGPYKDFDPVNRAGLPYHIWNIVTLSACADPPVIQKLVMSYYNAELHGYDRKPAHGRVKIEADFRAARQARRIRALFDRYAVDS